MTAKKLKKNEMLLVQMFANDEDYSLHRCDEHGVYAIRNNQLKLCPHCKQSYPEINVDDYLLTD
jgi:hypothetical protein